MLSPNGRLLGALRAAAFALPLIGAAGMVLAEQAEKDLTVEVAKPWPAVTVPVNASLLPVGSSLIRVGTPIRFRATSNSAGYAHVYIAGASGRVTMLTENLPVKANRSVDLPGKGLVIRATAPAGDDTVYLVVTRERLAGFAGGATTTTPADIQVSASGLAYRLNWMLSAMPRERWAWTQATVRVTE